MAFSEYMNFNASHALKLFLDPYYVRTYFIMLNILSMKLDVLKPRVSKICVKQRVGTVIPLDFQVSRDDYQCPML